MKLIMNITVYGKKVPIYLTNLEHLGLHGLWDPSNGHILIDENSNHKFQTVIHELVHQIFSRVGIDISGLSRELQEIIAENIANLVKENLKDINALKKKLES